MRRYSYHAALPPCTACLVRLLQEWLSLHGLTADQADALPGTSHHHAPGAVPAPLPASTAGGPSAPSGSLQRRIGGRRGPQAPSTPPAPAPGPQAPPAPVPGPQAPSAPAAPTDAHVAASAEEVRPLFPIIIIHCQYMTHTLAVSAARPLPRSRAPGCTAEMERCRCACAAWRLNLAHIMRRAVALAP